MADEVDNAQEMTETFNAVLDKYRAPPHPVAKATGRCLNCGARTGKARRWCDADCREDWERRNKR